MVMKINNAILRQGKYIFFENAVPIWTMLYAQLIYLQIVILSIISYLTFLDE